MTRNQGRTFLNCLLRSLFILACAGAVSGCLTLEEQRQIDESYRFRFYSRSEVDALNARSECRLLARNLVQVARCDGR
jgi:hypothetical protein